MGIIKREELNECNGDVTGFNGGDRHDSPSTDFKEPTRELHAAHLRLQRAYQTLQKQRLRESALYRGGMIALLKGVEARDELTGHHVERMALFSMEVSDQMGIHERSQLSEIFYVAILHDVGKVSIRDEVLNKPGPLSSEERRHIETHAWVGADIVGSIPGWERISHAVSAHHEWWDGTGYPFRMEGEEIPLSSRIVAVADVFDALTSERPYRRPLNYADACRHIKSEAGTHFDPHIVDVFLSVPKPRWDELRIEANSLTPARLLEEVLPSSHRMRSSKKKRDAYVSEKPGFIAQTLALQWEE